MYVAVKYAKGYTDSVGIAAEHGSENLRGRTLFQVFRHKFACADCASVLL